MALTLLLKKNQGERNTELTFRVSKDDIMFPEYQMVNSVAITSGNCLQLIQ